MVLRELRWTPANANAGADTIAFNIPGGTPQTISPSSALPAITDPVIIDGTTQPGYAGTPLVQITGLLAGDTATGLTIQAGQTTVKGAIHLLFFSTANAEPTVSHPRVIVIAEDNVEAQIVESYVGSSGRYFTNAVTEIVLGENAHLEDRLVPAFNVLISGLVELSTNVSHDANGDPAANCDGSSVSPILNANDFNCFLNLFANGCP